MLLTANQQLLRKTEEFVLEITDLESESLFPPFPFVDIGNFTYQVIKIYKNWKIYKHYSTDLVQLFLQRNSFLAVVARISMASHFLGPFIFPLSGAAGVPGFTAAQMS